MSRLIEAGMFSRHLRRPPQDQAVGQFEPGGEALEEKEFPEVDVHGVGVFDQWRQYV